MKWLTYKPPARIRHIKKRAWLLAFSKCGGIRRSCAAIDVHHSTYYEWLASDKEFSEAFNDCREQYIEWLEETADRLATAGKNPNVTALIFRLKAMRPEVYRERHEVTVTTEQVQQAARQMVQWVRGQAANGASDNGHAANSSEL